MLVLGAGAWTSTTFDQAWAPLVTSSSLASRDAQALFAYFLKLFTQSSFGGKGVGGKTHVTNPRHSNNGARILGRRVIVISRNLFSTLILYYK
jgi:hypothetical protein